MSEQEIFNQFDRLRNNKTTVFVSHRLSSATIADQILVIENGCLIEKGSHTALMAQGGKYAELFTTQSKRYTSERNSGTDVQSSEMIPGRGERRPGMHWNSK